MSRTRRSVRKEAGFTLVEMAIVLIIIGLIIGAILKGQDLIDNARGKRFASFARGAEISQWAYYDRFGRFAGDANNDGTIADSDPVTELSNELDNFAPSLNLGSTQFVTSFGMNGTKAAIVMTLPAGTTAFSDSAVIYAQSFDAAIDGVVNAETGNVIASVLAAAPTSGIATIDTEFALPGWGGGTPTALVYIFD